MSRHVIVKLLQGHDIVQVDNEHRSNISLSNVVKTVLSGRLCIIVLQLKDRPNMLLYIFMRTSIFWI